MAQNFIEDRRKQGFLLPPDVREWLPGDHLAWFVIDSVTEMDLSGFYGAYRADGHGRAAYEPSLMVALVLYAFATRVRSSRAIECHCRQDVAYRVISGNLVPDHVSQAGFDGDLDSRVPSLGRGSLQAYGPSEEVSGRAA
jgi:transposase